METVNIKVYGGRLLIHLSNGNDCETSHLFLSEKEKIFLYRHKFDISVLV